MISKGFYEELEIIAKEKHIELQDVFDVVTTAMIKACKLEGATGEVSVEFNEEQKKIRVFQTFRVVEEIDPEGPEGQILLEQAKEMRARVKVGNEFRTEISINSIGRKGATRFKAILIQGLKEACGKRAYEYFSQKQGEIINATIVGTTNRVVIDLGMDTHTILPLEETIPGEHYELGSQIKVCITKVEETGRGPKVYVSRTHRDLIKRLLETYIPEISQGVIEVINIAREPGSRTKIGIKSNNINVDAKGACVGVQGSRIKQINQALNGEKIDIFEWNDDPIKLIAEALTPSRVISVLIDEQVENRSTVIVPDDQFSLAIGRGGQNARMASQITGWKIDIKSESQAYEQGIKFKPNVYTI